MLLDSTVLIDVLRGDPRALGFLRSVAEPPSCSEITRVEIVRGLRSPERSRAERLFATIGWQVVDEGIARRAGELGRTYLRSHASIGVADLIVAATALEAGLQLATTNVRDFPMFKGLQRPYR